MEVNVLLDMPLYRWGGRTGRRGGGGGESNSLGRSNGDVRGRVTDAKFEKGEERRGNDEEGVRGGEVERKIQRCWEKLTDAAMEWEMQGKGWVVRG